MSDELEVRPRPDLLDIKLDCPGCRAPLFTVEAEEVDGSVWFHCECPLCGLDAWTGFDPGEEPDDPCATFYTVPLEAHLNGLTTH